MSIIKRPYEISVWEDVYSGTESSIADIDYTSESLTIPDDNMYNIGTYLNEKKIAVIGGDKITHQGGVSEPVLTLDTKGKTTLSFIIYRKYYDKLTGLLVENPFYKYIQNERKIKLYYDDGISNDKWRDFIITSISPETTNYKVSVVATDLAMIELSKIGFNKTFNSELQNNTDTISNLAIAAMDGTVWSLDDSSEEIKQFQTDYLVKAYIKDSIPITLYDNDEHDSDDYNINPITLNNNDIVYCFYSQLCQDIKLIKTISILFLKQGSSGNNWTSREATNKDYINNILQNAYYGTITIGSTPLWQDINNTNLHLPAAYFNTTGSYTDIEVLFTKKGKRLIQDQLMKYDKILNRYVKKYKKNNIDYYGYEDAEYTTTPLVQNLVTNGEKEMSLDGWYLCENVQMRQTRLGLNYARPDLSTTLIRDNYQTFPYIQYGTDVSPHNISLGSSDLFASHTHFGNFLANSGFQDNISIINNLQPNDKFRIQINVERNITKAVSIEGDNSITTVETLATLGGFHPYIVRLPKGKNSSDLMNDVSILYSNLYPTGDIMNITNNPIIINFSYVPQKYRMFDYERAYYYERNGSSSTKHTELAPFSEGSLVPIKIKKATGVFSKPIFYCPFWRIYNLKYYGLIDGDGPNPVFQESISGTWDGSYTTYVGDIYLTNKGKNNLLSYLQNNVSYFEPIDFCIIGDYLKFIRYKSNATTVDVGNNNNVTLNLEFFNTNLFSNNTPLFFDYFVMFSQETTSAGEIMARPSGNYTSQSIFEEQIYKLQNFRETYRYLGDTLRAFRVGYYKTNNHDANNFIIIIDKENDNLKINYTNASSGASVIYSWSGILGGDIDNILRIRNVWKLMHYEPDELVYYDNSHAIIRRLDVPYARCIFETEGTYYGTINNSTGKWYTNYVDPSIDYSTGIINYTYNNNTLLKEDLVEQENLILFSNYGSYASDFFQTNSSYIPLSISNVLLTRYYKDEENNIVVPDTIPSASTRTIYKYFNTNYGRENITDVEKENDILYSYIGYTANKDYIPTINTNGIAYNSITLTESNLFNIFQKLCEIFNCWLKISLEHDSTGRIILENNIPKGKISFHKYIGDLLYYGFTTGLNINSIQRQDTSDEIVTKMIVKQNNNEFGKDKFCTISRSNFNPPGGNEIYNFDYYINNGLLQNKIYEVLNETFGVPLNKIKNQTVKLEEEIKQLIVQLTQLKAERDYYQTQYDSATDEITAYKKYFETLTGKTYAYYLKTKGTNDDLDVKWSKDGLISLYEEYKEKIIYFTGIRSTSYILWKDREEKYQNTYNDYTKKNELITTLAAHRSKIMEEFYNIYHAYIREGSWISEDYLDDDKYFFAAQDVLNTSAQPKVTYTFNVVDIGSLEEFKGYNFKLGDKTFVEDPEFFGYEEDGITPYKEEVTISGMQINLDSPEKNTITIQNYRTQFQDLFQRIAATVQAVEYHTGNYRNTKTERP